jgi:hypothetical protein
MLLVVARPRGRSWPAARRRRPRRGPRCGRPSCAAYVASWRRPCSAPNCAVKLAVAVGEASGVLEHAPDRVARQGQDLPRRARDGVVEEVQEAVDGVLGDPDRRLEVGDALRSWPRSRSSCWVEQHLDHRRADQDDLDLRRQVMDVALHRDAMPRKPPSAISACAVRTALMSAGHTPGFFKHARPRRSTRNPPLAFTYEPVLNVGPAGAVGLDHAHAGDDHAALVAVGRAEEALVGRVVSPRSTGAPLAAALSVRTLTRKKSLGSIGREPGIGLMPSAPPSRSATKIS